MILSVSTAQPLLARLAVFGQPANDVAPELSEIAVVAFAPVMLEVAPPVDGGVARHGECAAATERLAGENGRDPRAGKRTLRKPQGGGGRLQAVGQVGAVKEWQGSQDLAVARGIIDDLPDGMVHRLRGNHDAEGARIKLGSRCLRWPLMSTGIRPSQTVWSQPPEPKLVKPPIMAKPPRAWRPARPSIQAAAAESAARAMSLQMTTS